MDSVPQPPSLETIPVDIFMQVVDYLYTSRDITNLSCASKQLNSLSKEHAWHRFVLSKFPSLTNLLHRSNLRNGYDSNGIVNLEMRWEHLARSLTSQSRAWERRAFSATRISPSTIHRPDIDGNQGEIYRRITKFDPMTRTHTTFGSHCSPGRRKPKYQTTGDHPVIDADLEFTNCLHNKKEIVAWSRGERVHIRVRRSGSMSPSKQECRDYSELFNDPYNNITNAMSFSHPEYVDGLDDVSTLNIIPPTLDIRADSEGLIVDLLVGRTNGHLNRFSVNMRSEEIESSKPEFKFPSEYGELVVVNTFIPGPKQGETRRRITSTDYFGNDDSSLACTSDTYISLYKLQSLKHDIKPLDEMQVETQGRHETTAVKFLSHEKLVVGIKNHGEALRTFQATPSGLRQLDRVSNDWNHVQSKSQQTSVSKNSVYAIAPLPTTSRPGGNPSGDVFLSSWYEGPVV
jgi:hypothetical protein